MNAIWTVPIQMHIMSHIKNIINIGNTTLLDYHYNLVAIVPDAYAVACWYEIRHLEKLINLLIERSISFCKRAQVLHFTETINMDNGYHLYDWKPQNNMASLAIFLHAVNQYICCHIWYHKVTTGPNDIIYSLQYHAAPLQVNPKYEGMKLKWGNLLATLRCNKPLIIV